MPTFGHNAMPKLRSSIFIFLILVLAPFDASAQTTPKSLCATPAVVQQTNPYWVQVGDAGGMSVGVVYKYNAGVETPIDFWPPAFDAVNDYFGEKYVTTLATTPTGNYEFVKVRNYGDGGEWIDLPTSPGVTVVPATNWPDFSLHSYPCGKAANQGASVTFPIEVSSLDGFNLPVSLSFTGASGISGSFSLTTVNPGSSVTLSLTTSSDTAGTYSLIVRGTASDGTVHELFLILTVLSPSQTPDFTVSLTPASVSKEQGQPASFTVNTTAIFGFDSPITLSATGIPAGVTSSFSVNPVMPGQSSTLTLSISTNAAIGTSTITVTGTSGALTHLQSSTLSILYRQPTTVSFSVTSGYAGNDCYTMTVGNAADMTVDLMYLFGGSSSTFRVTLDSGGKWYYCLNQNNAAGSYEFYRVKNAASQDWPPELAARATYTVKPPKPTSFIFNETTPIQAGAGSYTVVVGNGAGAAIDIKYKYGNQTQTALYFTDLDVLDQDRAPGARGTKTIGVSQGTCAGEYTVTAVKNRLNPGDEAGLGSTWLSLSNLPTVTVTAAPGFWPEPIGSISPSSGGLGSVVDITISGNYLCGASVTLSAINAATQSAWPGVTVSNLKYSQTAVTATLTIASNAPSGTAKIRVNADGRLINLDFVIGNVVSPPAALSKEYVYAGGRLLAVESVP